MATALENIRLKFNISKDDMAAIFGVSRQTYYKYESGESKLDVEQIKLLSKKFNLNCDDIINNKIDNELEYNIVSSGVKEKKNVNDIRINIPIENIEKFKQVLLYILKKVGSFPNVGKTVIYKLLYFIDFDYYELYEEQLMGLKYIKNNYGPTPVSFDKLIADFEKEGYLETTKSKYYSYDMLKYTPLKEPDLNILSAREIKFIDDELEKHASKTASELSELSHKDIPWIGANDKELIEYEAVFYRNKDTSVRKYEDEI